jgi:hypothetical protein
MAHAEILAMSEIIEQGASATDCRQQRVRVGEIVIPPTTLAFDVDDDGHIARIAEVPANLENAGIHNGYELCELDGEPGYQVVDQLMRGERVLQLGMAVTVKFSNGSEMTTVRVLFTDGMAEQPAELSLEALIAESMDLRRRSSGPDSASEEVQLIAPDAELPAVAAADEHCAEPARALPQEQEPALPPASTFGPKPYPPNCPEQDRRWFDESRHTVSYSAIDESYNALGWLPDRGPL